MLHSLKTAGLLQQGHRRPRMAVCSTSMPQIAPSRRPPPLLRQTQTAGLPGGLQLVVDSTMPVLKIGMVCAAGALSARFGMLNEEARRALSKLAINVFTPAIMITKLGAHTDLASALSLWYIGANVILCHFVGLGLGVLHTRLLPTPPNLKHIVQVSSSIANTGNLPLVLVLSLIKSPNLPFNTAAQAELAVSYIMLGWWYATLVQMPLGTLLLHKPKAQQAATATAAAGNTTAVAGPATAAAAAVTSQNNVVSFSGSSSSSSKLAEQDVQQGLVATPQARQQLHVLRVGAAAPVQAGLATLQRPGPAPPSLTSLEMQMQSSTIAQQIELGGGSYNSLDSSSSSSSSSSHTHLWPATSHTSCIPSLSLPASTDPTGLQGKAMQQLPVVVASVLSCFRQAQLQHQHNPQGQPVAKLELPLQQQGPLQLLHQLVEQRFRGWWTQHAAVAEPLLKGVLSAPLVAGIVAIMIGSCPPLQEALFSPRGSLSLVGDVLDMLGQPLIPVLLLVLGANLSNGPQLASGAHLPALNVAAVIGSKLILSPLLGLGLILGAQKFGVIGAATDPLAVLVMMVAWSTPTAVLVHSLSLVHKNGEDEVSALLFYEYLAAALTLPLCSAVYLYVLGCCVPQVA